ncbi:hypothetical protein [Intrasporangium flavum]|uniref:hypothetical protein n=1 Tax=Intrasporangium flavum TaxID=1428657 RepID=UPI00096E3CBE|nr:hypothetical protein [Intrasporangium flavum]
MAHAQHLSTAIDEHGPHLATLSIRELIGTLAGIEDRLRHTPTLVVLGGRLVVNPERRLLLRRQRLVVTALRRRRATLRLPMHGH